MSNKKILATVTIEYQLYAQDEQDLEVAVKTLEDSAKSCLQSEREIKVNSITSLHNVEKEY